MSFSAAKSTLRIRFNFACGNFYIGPRHVPKQHSGDISVIIIDFTTIPGHVKYLFHFPVQLTQLRGLGSILPAERFTSVHYTSLNDIRVIYPLLWLIVRVFRHILNVYSICCSQVNFEEQVQFCPRKFLYRSAKRPETLFRRYIYYYNQS